MKYSVVIPTYNEKNNIAVLIRRLVDVFAKSFPDSEYEIIVADDNSPDLTWKFVAEEFPNDNRIKVLRRMSDHGLSQSIIAGFNIATGDVFAVMDADLQHDESCLPGILRKSADFALVAGTRFSCGGAIEGGWPLSRKIMSFFANLMAKSILNIKISDPMSGFFAIRKTAYNKVKEHLDPKGFKILLELLYILTCADKNAKIAESGIFFRKRMAGESKMSLMIILTYLQSLVRLRMNRKKYSA